MVPRLNMGEYFAYATMTRVILYGIKEFVIWIQKIYVVYVFKNSQLILISSSYFVQ